MVSLPEGASVRNTFLEFAPDDGESFDAEDPWIITLDPRRQKTDSLLLAARGREIQQELESSMRAVGSNKHHDIGARSGYGAYGSHGPTSLAPPSAHMLDPVHIQSPLQPPSHLTGLSKPLDFGKTPTPGLSQPLGFGTMMASGLSQPRDYGPAAGFENRWQKPMTRPVSQQKTVGSQPMSSLMEQDEADTVAYQAGFAKSAPMSGLDQADEYGGYRGYGDYYDGHGEDRQGGSSPSDLPVPRFVTDEQSVFTEDLHLQHQFTPELEHHQFAPSTSEEPEPEKELYPEERRMRSHENNAVRGPDSLGGSKAPVTVEILLAREVAAAGGGLSGMTTVMIRHVPVKYMQQKLMRELNSVGFLGKYDFFYLPMESQVHANRGFAFANFISVEAADEFYKHFHGNRLRHFASEKVLAILPADLQGFEKNAEHYTSMSSSTRRGQNRALFFKPLPPQCKSEDHPALAPPMPTNQQFRPPAQTAQASDGMKASLNLADATLDARQSQLFGLDFPMTQQQQQHQNPQLQQQQQRLPRSAQKQGKQHTGGNFSQQQFTGETGEEVCPKRRFCTACGQTRQPDHRFCAYCGHAAW